MLIFTYYAMLQCSKFLPIMLNIMLTLFHCADLLYALITTYIRFFATASHRAFAMWQRHGTQL